MVAVPVATIASAALPVMMRASSSPVRSRMARRASCSKLGAPERIACTKSVSPTQRGAPVGSATASTATDSVTTGDGTLDVSSAATSCTVASWAGVGANRSGPSRSESSSALSSIRRDSRSACECSDTKPSVTSVGRYFCVLRASISAGIDVSSPSKCPRSA